VTARPLTATLTTLALVLSACGEKEEAPITAPTGGQGGDTKGGRTGPSAADLRGSAFVATLDGSDLPLLVPEPRVKVSFHKRKPGTGIGWQARCNDFGAKVEIAAHRIQVGRVAGTLMACPNAEQAQDQRLGRFFGADPRWQLRGDTLTLMSEGRVLVACRPTCPRSTAR
jgi:heat shock protein HslJ